MGSLYRVGKVWYLSYYDLSGWRIRRSARTQFKEAARLALRSAELHAAQGQVQRPALRLSAFLASYLDAQQHGLAKTTHARYRDCLRNLVADESPLTSLMLDNVTVGRISQYAYWRLAERGGKATIEKELGWLKGALTEAARRELVSWESVARIKDELSRSRFPALRGAGAHRDRVLLPHELPILVGAPSTNENLRDALVMALYTGLRQGNIRLLTEAQVDFSCEPAIARFAQESMKGRESHLIYLPPKIQEMLWNRWQGIPGRRFFLDFRPAWKRLQKRLASALPGLRFQDLRRTYITYRLAAGIDPKTVQAEVGHKDSRMTMDCYARSVRDPGIRAWARQHFRFPYDAIVTEQGEHGDQKRTTANVNEPLKLA